MKKSKIIELLIGGVILATLVLAGCIHQGLPENIENSYLKYILTCIILGFGSLILTIGGLYFIIKRRLKWYIFAIFWHLISLVWIFINPLGWILPSFIGWPTTSEISWTIAKIAFFPTFLCYYSIYSFFVYIACSDPHEAVWVFWPSIFVAVPWYLITTYFVFKVGEVIGLKWKNVQ